MSPNPLMLLRIAQADAYACAVEYIARSKHEALFAEALRFERYLERPELKDVEIGRYSDDTQMSIAVAEALIEHPNPNVLRFGDKFIECYKRDPRGGYSDRVKNALVTAGTGVALLMRGDADSDFNGAAMRAVPIGVLPDPQLVAHVAAKQALLTHDTYGGSVAAQVVALASHFALYCEEPFASHLNGFLGAHGIAAPVLASVLKPWDGRVTVGKNKPGMGLLTARAVITLLREEHSLMSIMRRIIEWGGDTDSVAAIAWGIASARYQDEVLPGFMERDLEPGGAYGPKFLRDLGQNLMEKYVP